jgi:integrase/recombinase XerD
MRDSWNFEMDDKTLNIYRNLNEQIEKVFRHTRQGSIKTRERYEDALNHFAKFLAEGFKKQNLNKIEPKHLEAYVEQMQECGYSKSYISTNLSAIRFFIDVKGGDSKKLPSNKELGVEARTKQDRIGDNKAWSNEEVEKIIVYVEENGEKRYADMVKVAYSFGLRIHEVARLDRSQLGNALRTGLLTIKGKGGLIRGIPLHNKELIEGLYEETKPGEKVFMRNNEKTHKVINNLQVFIYNHQKDFMTTDDGRNRSFHGLRHLYAQNRYRYFREKGMDDYKAKLKVSKELGHFRVEITEIYLN